MLLKITDICGVDCLDAGRAEDFVRHISSAPERIEVSFAGIGAISRTFADVLASAVVQRKVRGAEFRIQLIDMPPHHAEVMRQSIAAVRTERE